MISTDNITSYSRDNFNKKSLGEGGWVIEICADIRRFVVKQTINLYRGIYEPVGLHDIHRHNTHI